MACDDGKIDIIKYWVNQVEFNKVEYIQNAFDYACMNGQFEIVKYMYNKFCHKLNIQRSSRKILERENRRHINVKTKEALKKIDQYITMMESNRDEQYYY